MKHFITSLVILLVALLVILSFAVPVFAIDDPNSIYINGVWVYRNCLEDDDQLYIVDYSINYTVNPDESVTEAFLLRLMNGSTELASVAPYTFYDDGYGRGTVAIYFAAVDAPTWEGAYTMILVGNPTLSWAGDPPSASVSTFNLWQDYDIQVTRQIVSSRVLWLADQLELAWDVDMIETTGSGSVLTTYGEAYFPNVIPNLKTIAPYAFSGKIVSPETDRREFTQDYADELETNIAGTPLDLTDSADAIGVSRGAWTAILYYGVVIIFAIMAVRKIGSYKPLMLFMLPLVILGAFIGVPLVITVLFGFLSLVMIGFSLFYRPSTA